MELYTLNIYNFHLSVIPQKDGKKENKHITKNIYIWATTWMNLEYITLLEISQSLKDRCRMIPLT